MDTMSYLRGRRLWVVADILVWGTANAAEFHFLGVENIAGQTRVNYGSVLLGGGTQELLFADLVDFRGNHLPAAINQPKVFVRARSANQAFVMGEESASGFRIARDGAAPGPVRVDLFIYEMG
jgi:hypothetical protein